MKRRIPEWTFGDRIAKCRREAGMTQGALGAVLFVDGSTVSTWEADKHAPNRLAVERIAELANVPVDWLLHGGGVTGAVTDRYLRTSRPRHLHAVAA